jgi:DNA mismatch endonuclease, patch repair protein
MALPYPSPTSETASRIMRANRRGATRPEILVRSVLHGHGLRFRKSYVVVAGDVQVRPDVTFPGSRVALFIDGCFWHRCETHRSVPASNVNYWAPKLQRNVDRDRRVDAALAAAGWAVLRVWEHELAGGLDCVAILVRDAVAARGDASRRGGDRGALNRSGLG